MTYSTLITELKSTIKKYGLRKNFAAKCIGIDCSTLSRWFAGYFKPTAENEAEIRDFIDQYKVFGVKTRS
jgi:hypothetical protein